MRTTTALVVLALVSTAHAHGTREHIIEAHGVDRFDQVEQIRFTFNVERDGELRASRTWTWRPHEQTVTRTMNGESVTYSRAEPDQINANVDKQFINDTFWLLPALHIMWAPDDVRIEATGKAPMPIGEGEAHRVILAYPAEGGGYTPGDVYELFLDDHALVRAWHFRRGGREEPNLTNTFEDYIDAGPLKIATEHRNADGSFRLYFTDVKVIAVSD